MRPGLFSTPFRHRAATAMLAAMLVVSGSHVALADEAAARVHFKKGIELYDKKQYADALAEFREAYKQKPSAGIKQNIALSLKGLNRPAEAATALDEALDEGKDTLKPATRASIEQELAELSKSVATVTITAVTAGAQPEDRRPAQGVVVSIVPAAGAKLQMLSGDALRRPIRLMPGIYTFTARAPGYPDPPEKKLALVSGAPVDVTFVLGSIGGGAGSPISLGPNEGYLEVTTNVPDAAVRVDGVGLPQRGGYNGKISAGQHTIEISSPGWKTTTLEINVTAGARVDQPVKLTAIGEAPPEYTAKGMTAPKPKRFYLVLAAAGDTASYRLGVPLGEPVPYGTRRPFVGATVGGRFGAQVAKMIAVEALVEVGGMKAKYKLQEADDLETETSITHVQLTPMLRFVTPGKVRFTAGTGFGLHSLGVETKVAQRGSTLTKKGSGAGCSWLIDSGVQVDVGPLYLEGALFLDLHWVGSVKDDDPLEDRVLYASPATRGGLRVGLGIPF